MVKKKFSGIQVTDLKWYDERMKKHRIGYYMDWNLAQNLSGIPNYLKKDYDCIAIVSGTSEVRTGKSTIAQQMGHYVAWMLAGGRMGPNEHGKWVVVKKPNKPVNFSLNNLVFNPDDMTKKAYELYNKYGKNQVIIYDEGRTGMDASRAMEQANKNLSVFFEQVGVMNHVIIIVLPNFFKLHEDYTTNRSLFLVNCFRDKRLRRGYFSFYNKIAKELLYHRGKKEVGTYFKYSAARPNFYGRFTKFSPFDKEEYDNLKRKELKKTQGKKHQAKFKRQRDALIYLLKRVTGWPNPTIAQELSVISGEQVRAGAIDFAISNITHKDSAREEME